MPRLPLATILLPVLAAGCMTPERAPPLTPAIAPARPAPAPVRLIGSAPDRVVALLGAPTLDRQEGPARHLQFAGGHCVVDVFFYPDPDSGRLRATDVETRRRDGGAIELEKCLAARGLG